jgi:hypothetical protein
VLGGSVLSTAMRMGVVGMAKLMADEFGPYNITVNNVAPGLILTDRIIHTIPKGADPDEFMKEKTKAIPLGRIGNPEELAALVAFLASEQAAYISGTTIQVDGGANRAILTFDYISWKNYLVALFSLTSSSNTITILIMAASINPKAAPWKYSRALV